MAGVPWPAPWPARSPSIGASAPRPSAPPLVHVRTVNRSPSAMWAPRRASRPGVQASPSPPLPRLSIRRASVRGVSLTLAPGSGVSGARVPRGDALPIGGVGQLAAGGGLPGGGCRPVGPSGVAFLSGFVPAQGMAPGGGAHRRPCAALAWRRCRASRRCALPVACRGACPGAGKGPQGVQSRGSRVSARRAGAHPSCAGLVPSGVSALEGVQASPPGHRPQGPQGVPSGRRPPPAQCGQQRAVSHALIIRILGPAERLP